MDGEERRTDGDAAQVFVEELLRTAFSLGGVYVELLEGLPENAFPGEDRAAVLIEMFAGSSRPALQAASEADRRIAIALVGAVRDRVLTDLGTAARLAEPEA